MPGRVRSCGAEGAEETRLKALSKGTFMAVVGGALGVALALLIALGPNDTAVHTGAGVAYTQAPVPAVHAP